MRGTIWAVAGRTFFRNLPRYRVVLLALVLVVAAVVMVTGAVLGMSQTLRGKASRYFAGDLVVLGYDGSGRSRIDDVEAIRSVVTTSLSEAGIETITWSERSTYYEAGDSQLFFAGYYVPQRRLVGVQWHREAPILATFDFVEGGVPSADDREGILISTAAARRLEARVGDQIIVSAITRRGRVNTAPLLVRGIFGETSFFGFTSYLHQETLNILVEEPRDRVNEMGVYLARPAVDEEPAVAVLHQALTAAVPTFEVIRDRDTYSDASRQQRAQREYGIVTLTAQLEEIQDLIGAIILIAVVIMGLFLLIVVVGVSNTYAMIVFERTREIGTMRALGMQRPGVVALFVIESLYLALTGGIIGVAGGFAGLALIRAAFDFAGRNWATLFLVQGRLVWSMPAAVVGAITVITMSAAVAGSLRAALRAAAISPVDALRQE